MQQLPLQKQLLALCSGKCKTARPHGDGHKGMCYLRITPKHLYKPAARAKNRKKHFVKSNFTAFDYKKTAVCLVFKKPQKNVIKLKYRIIKIRINDKYSKGELL